MSTPSRLGLRRVFGDKVAVDDLDLTVDTGTFFGYLGPNGAAKSTTIKMLAGFHSPTSGTAKILGRDVVAAAGDVAVVVARPDVLVHRVSLAPASRLFETRIEASRVPA